MESSSSLLQPKIMSWMNFNIDNQQLPRYLVIGIILLFFLQKVTFSGQTLFFIVIITIGIILYHVYSDTNFQSHKLLVKQLDINLNEQNRLVFEDILLLQLLIKLKNLGISNRNLKLLIYELHKMLHLSNLYQQEFYYKNYYETIRQLQATILNQIMSYELIIAPNLTYIKNQDIFVKQNQVHTLYLIKDSLEEYFKKHNRQLIFLGSKNWALNEITSISHPMDIDSGPSALESTPNQYQSHSFYE